MYIQYIHVHTTLYIYLQCMRSALNRSHSRGDLWGILRPGMHHHGQQGHVARTPQLAQLIVDHTPQHRLQVTRVTGYQLPGVDGTYYMYICTQTITYMYMYTCTCTYMYIKYTACSAHTCTCKIENERKKETKISIHEHIAHFSIKFFHTLALIVQKDVQYITYSNNCVVLHVHMYVHVHVCIFHYTCMYMYMYI